MILTVLMTVLCVPSPQPNVSNCSYTRFSECGHPHPTILLAGMWMVPNNLMDTQEATVLEIKCLQVVQFVSSPVGQHISPTSPVCV